MADEWGSGDDDDVQLFGMGAGWAHGSGPWCVAPSVALAACPYPCPCFCTCPCPRPCFCTCPCPCPCFCHCPCPCLCPCPCPCGSCLDCTFGWEGMIPLLCETVCVGYAVWGQPRLCTPKLQAETRLRQIAVLGFVSGIGRCCPPWTTPRASGRVNGKG